MPITNRTEDLEAINRYMLGAEAKTPKAKQIKGEWPIWYSDLGWYAKSYDQSVYDEARSRRNAFNIANAVTPEQKADVEQVLTKGLTTEQMLGQGDRPSIDTKTGKVTTEKTTYAATTLGHKTIKMGSTGPDVVAWQDILGIKADGKFGLGTDQSTRAWQSRNGLKPDGVVGPATWAKALGGSPVSDETLKAAVRNAPPPPVFAPDPREEKVNKQTLSKVATAGMLPSFDNVPTWAKAAGVVIIAGAAYSASRSGAKKHGF